MERTTTQRYYRSRWYLEGFWFLLEDFFKDYIFAWWNIWIFIILLLPSDTFWCKWQGHSVTHPLFYMQLDVRRKQNDWRLSACGIEFLGQIVKSKKHVGTLPLRHLTAINEVGNGGGWLSHQQPPDPLSISDQVVNMIKIENFLCKFSSSKTGWCGLGGHVCFFGDDFFSKCWKFLFVGFISPKFERIINLKSPDYMRTSSW